MSVEFKGFYEFGDFRLEPKEHLLLRNGKAVPLMPKAFETLLVLVQRSGRLVEKDDLMREVWAEAFVEEANLARNIWTLRKALGEDNDGHKYIETVSKRGYRFVAPVTLRADPDVGLLVQRRVRARIVTAEEIFDEPGVLDRTTNEAARVIEAAVAKRHFAVGRARALSAGVLALLALSVVALFAVSHWSKSSPPVQIKSIAVLPLRSLNEAENTKDLGLGLTDALITKLGSLRLVTVRPTSAVQRFVNVDTDAIQIGRDLQADAVLEGTIQQAEGRLRVNARLLMVATGEQVWAEKFDEPGNELFALEDALSTKIAKTLSFELRKPELERLASRRTQNPEAYEKYLRGRFYQSQSNEAGLVRSIEFYEQAIALDPNFAEAHAGLADANMILFNFGWRSPDEVIPKAKESLHRALELNPDLPGVYNSLALIQFLAEHDWKAAEQSLQTAIELDPNNADAFQRYGYFLINVGKFDEALAKLEKARTLNPLSPIIQANIGLAYLCARRYPQAIEVLERVAADNPQFPLANWFLGTAYEGIDDTDKAFAAYLRALETEGNTQLAGRMRSVKETAGLQAANQLWLDETLKARKAGHESAINLANRYATLKNREQTIVWLEKAFDEGERTLTQIQYVARYDFLRDDERFQRLVKKIEFKEN